MLVRIVVVPFTPDVVDVGDIAFGLVRVVLAFVVGWFIVSRW